MKKILVLLLVASMLSTVVYGYMVSQVKTNDQIIKIGNAGDEATLTYLGNQNDVLVPNYITNLSTNEVTSMTFNLTVNSDELRYYHLDSELPSEFTIETNRPSGEYYYTTGVTYTITIQLLEQVEYTEYTFYLYVNFM